MNLEVASPARDQVAGHFVDGAKGPLFVLVRQPLRTTADSCVLVVPPFAEEMNKARRMVTVLSQGLASRGLATVIPDLYGTGDSAGDFADADWGCWLTDIERVSTWCRQRDLTLSGVLAIRLGAALLAAAVSQRAMPAVRRTAPWQPVFDGPRFLTQFLRLRVAASMMERDRSESVPELRGRLKNGDALEVAGYALSGKLAAGLDAMAPPAQLPQQMGRVQWIEVIRDSSAPLPTPAMNLIGRSRSGGVEVETRTFVGEPFWASTEIVCHSEIVEATSCFLADVTAADHGARSG